jgi:hypothetical protein
VAEGIILEIPLEVAGTLEQSLPLQEILAVEVEVVVVNRSRALQTVLVAMMEEEMIL